MAPNRGPGTYRIYVSQEEYGTAEFYAYQGPFWARIFFLPLFSILVLIIASVTFSKKTIEVTAEPAAQGIDADVTDSNTSVPTETVLECKTNTTVIDAEIVEETVCEPVEETTDQKST